MLAKDVCLVKVVTVTYFLKNCTLLCSLTYYYYYYYYYYYTIWMSLITGLFFLVLLLNQQ